MADGNRVYVLHAVQGVLKRDADTVRSLWCDRRRRDRRMRDLLEQAKRLGIAVHEVANEELDRLSEGARHQGVVAEVSGTSVHNESFLDELLTGLDRPAFLLVLDGVQDPHNLGACLRTADAAGVKAVILPRDRAVGVTASVRKVASGAAENLPIIEVTNLARTLRQIRDAGVWVVGTSDRAEQTIYQLDLDRPLALAMGAEGMGIRENTRKQCDAIVRLPMQGVVESLNVSVATGICLYEVLRQRLGPG